MGDFTNERRIMAPLKMRENGTRFYIHTQTEGEVLLDSAPFVDAFRAVGHRSEMDARRAYVEKMRTLVGTQVECIVVNSDGRSSVIGIIGLTAHRVSNVVELQQPRRPMPASVSSPSQVLQPVGSIVRIQQSSARRTVAFSSHRAPPESRVVSSDAAENPLKNHVFASVDKFLAALEKLGISREKLNVRSATVYVSNRTLDCAVTYLATIDVAGQVRFAKHIDIAKALNELIRT